MRIKPVLAGHAIKVLCENDVVVKHDEAIRELVFQPAIEGLHVVELLVEYSCAGVVDVFLRGCYERSHVYRRFGGEVLLLTGGVLAPARRQP